MASEAQDPMEAFEAWLLHRVAHAVEAGEVSGDLLTELQAELEAARERPHAEGHAVVVQEIAERLDVPAEPIEHLLAAFEAQPSVTRRMLLRRIAETWLAEQRKEYGTKGTPRDSDGDQ